ncbi:MAG TPA: monovalent cation/H(+) antiporter subunit G [Actinomycetales bacterium]|nr:monovalent cation/H(+) antiporter subunit G [Actinomycetales bacterium]
MNWALFADILGAIAFVLGSLLTLAAAIGVVRFPDLLSRLHAVSKPQSLGISLMMIGLAISVRDAAVAWTALLVVLFQLVTAPISAHLAGRAGYRAAQVDSRTLHTDEYRRDIAASLRAERRRKQKEKAEKERRERRTR